MRRLRRGLLFGAFVLVLLLSALSSLAVVTVRASFPTVDGDVTLPGLRGRVEVLRDAYGVPQIYADTAEDLFFAQGYVQAQERFFEMDFRRHIVAGRLSEWFGDSQYSTDAFVRTLGWRRTAEQEVAGLSSTTRRYLSSYTAGVNAYLADRSPDDLALEYVVLGLTGLDYTPEPWTPADSVGWLKAMAWQLGSNIDQETEQARVGALLGPGRARELWPESDPDDSPRIVTTGALRGGVFDPTVTGNARPLPADTTPDGPAVGPADSHAESPEGGSVGTAAGPTTPGSVSEVDAVPAAALPALQRTADGAEALAELLGEAGLGSDIGSNSWVVAGSRTTTGKPLLSNDPHLATSMPSTFLQMGLHCRTVGPACPFDVAGYSFSGMPGIIIGHNAHIAWGFTTSYVDVQDLYLEKIVDGRAEVDGGWEPVQTRTEQIAVLGEEPRTLTIRTTRHGPVLSDVDSSLADAGRAGGPAGDDAGSEGADATQYAVALAWSGGKAAKTMDALFAIDAAQDFEAFRAGAKDFAAPSQNIVYADTEGNIGYQLNGAIPIRGAGNGVALNPGWNSAYDWKGLIPFEALPYSFNPPSGIIVTANQAIMAGAYPYILNTGDESYGWRSDRINQVLSSLPAVSPDDSAALFNDTRMGIAADLTPLLLRIKVDDAWVREGQAQLVGWDYTAPADSAAAAFFNVVLRDVWQLTFHDDLPEDLWPTGGERWQAVVAQLLDQPRSWWWDDHRTPQVETRDDILLAAMTQARKDITVLISRDPSGWQWGKLHRGRLISQTLGSSGIKPVEAIFNRGNIEMSGSSGAVNAMAWNALTDFTVIAGPTMRMLVDLSDLDASRWVNQSGTSGHPFATHYADQMPLWASGRLWAFAFSRGAVDAATEHTLVLHAPGA